MAKATGRASRAGFKIDEIQTKYHLVQPGYRVVDLGCAPGGWLQSLAAWVGSTGLVVGVDRNPVQIALMPNLKVIEADIEEVHTLAAQVMALLEGEADIVLSDMAPHTTGVKFQDNYRSYELAQMAWRLAQAILRIDGNFVVKIFEGPCLAPAKDRKKRAGDRLITGPKIGRRSGGFRDGGSCLLPCLHQVHSLLSGTSPSVMGIGTRRKKLRTFFAHRLGQLLTQGIPWIIAAGIFYFLFQQYPPGRLITAIGYANLPGF
ncbi:MAG: RlmE family RNA methyltransferase, partial [Deltaproteobacteria bacterium]|nr:RlmE family RNA methyltransferase [Deltaproteobacteria bacterium]